MFRPASIRLLCSWVAAFALLLGGPRALADASSGAVGLILFGDELPREELRAALARDLGRGVTLLPNPVATMPLAQRRPISMDSIAMPMKRISFVATRKRRWRRGIVTSPRPARMAE
jgi:hypothetical protein